MPNVKINGENRMTNVNLWCPIQVRLYKMRFLSENFAAYIDK